MLNYLQSLFMKPATCQKKESFNLIIEVAKDISEKNPYALNDYIRLLGRKLQSDYMCKRLSYLDENRMPELSCKKVWFNDMFRPITEKGEDLFTLKKKFKLEKDVNLYLAKDVILPWPWNTDRISSCISHIGNGKTQGEWKQDSNHKVEYWEPFGISWVHGGNHSIMTGIIQGEGMLRPYKVYDMSFLFEYVYCDGVAFYRKFDNQVIKKVSDVEFAAIFEIGRMIHHQKSKSG